MCSVNEPLVKVMGLVDGDKCTMGYLYEAMDRDKETIRTYYVGKGTLGYNMQMMLWYLIDSRWIRMLHRPIHAASLLLNLTFFYKCNFDFDGEVLEGLIGCLQRMVPDYETRNALNHNKQVYQGAFGLFGFDDTIRERTTSCHISH